MRRTDHRDNQQPKAVQPVQMQKPAVIAPAAPSTRPKPSAEPPTELQPLDFKPPKQPEVSKPARRAAVNVVASRLSALQTPDLGSWSRRRWVVIVCSVVVALVGIVLFMVTLTADDKTQETAQSTPVNGETVSVAQPGSTTTALNNPTQGGQQPTEQPVITASYAKVPSDLQAAILAVVKRDFPDCVKDNTIVDSNGQPYNPTVDYSKAGFARAPLGCEGGAAYLLVKPGDEWKDVEATQDYFTCDTVDLFKVPKAILEKGDPNGQAQCFDGSNVRTYL